MIKLQNVILGDDLFSDRRDLFYTREDRLTSSILNFGTYFNTFWFAAWKEYTSVDRFYFNLRFKGECVLTLFQSRLCSTPADSFETGHFDSSKVSVKVLHRHTYTSDGTEYVRVGVDGNDSTRMIFFELEYRNDRDFNYIDAFYSADDPDLSKRIKIAMVMCTFKREHYVYRNINLIKNYFHRYPELKDAYDLFVIDNGGTVSTDIRGDSVFLYRNKNTGGSGGFARGIIEALQSEEKYTHVLLMDDDIEINPEALQRTYAIASLCHSAYRRSFISGSMLQGDLKDSQWEARARLTGMRLTSYGQFSLKSFPSLFINELLATQHTRHDYAAWWYCCIPIETIGLDRLPFPFFVRGDDIDYSLRYADKIIHLNGICVWHEPFEERRNNVIDIYMTIRNFIAVNLMHHIPMRRTLFDLMYIFAGNIYTYNYSGNYLLCRGLQDAISRTDIFEQDHLELIRRYSAYNETEEDHPVNLSAVFEHKELTFLMKLILFATYGGHFLPNCVFRTRNETIGGCHITLTKCFASKHIYIYNPRTGKSLHRKINRLAAIKLGFVFLYLLLKYILLFPLTKRRLQAKEKYYRTIAFWKKHLALT